MPFVPPPRAAPEASSADGAVGAEPRARPKSVGIQPRILDFPSGHSVVVGRHLFHPVDQADGAAGTPRAVADTEAAGVPPRTAWLPNSLSLPSRQGESSNTSSSDSFASAWTWDARDEIARGIIHVPAKAPPFAAPASAPAWWPDPLVVAGRRRDSITLAAARARVVEIVTGRLARLPDPLVVVGEIGGAEPRPKPPPPRLSKAPPPLPPDSWAEGPAPPVPLDVQRNTVVSDVVHLPGDSSAAAIPECAICLEAFAPGQQVRTLPCMHRFHMQCADHWLRRGIPLCPVCRNPVVM